MIVARLTSIEIETIFKLIVEYLKYFLNERVEFFKRLSKCILKSSLKLAYPKLIKG